MGSSASIEYSQPIKTSEEAKGETVPYRFPGMTAEETLNDSMPNGDKDLNRMIENAVREFANNPCLGTRECSMEEVTDEEGNTKQVPKYGKYVWKTYVEVYEMAKFLARSMINHELCPDISSDEGVNRLIGIYSKNREEWCITDMASVISSVVTIPLYDTLGDNSFSFIVNQTELTTIAMGKDKINHIIKLKQEEKIDSVANIILFDEVSEEETQKLTDAGFRVYTIGQLISEGKENKIKLKKPTKDSIFTICYTSGTTGDPKGVISSHQNYAATIGGLFRTGFDVHQQDSHYSYLPLAHVFERAAHWALLSVGGKIGYYVGDVTKIKEDCAALKPSVFCSVPRLLNRFYDLMQDGIKKQTGIKKKLVNRGIKVKLNNLKKNGSVKDSMYDALVFKKFRQTLGGRVRLMITGSAPISNEVLSFLKIAFSCKVFEAYGQTETTGGLTITNARDGSSGHVGGTFPHCEIKLVDVPEMDYTSEDVIDGVPQPRGEVCCRGFNNFIGYFKNKEKTDETKDSDGWVHTGDIGQILPNGALRIIDRKKNIFKLAQGEYIAAEKLENAFGKLDVVKQIFIYGDSLQSYLVAIIVPEKPNVLKWAESAGVEYSDSDSAYQELINGEDFKKHLTALIAEVRKSEKLSGLEIPKAMYSTPEEFSMENDLLTPTFKLKRNEAKKKYYAQIKDMYKGEKLQGE